MDATDRQLGIGLNPDRAGNDRYCMILANRVLVCTGNHQSE